MKIIYYILQWTWGVIMNIIGLGVFLFAKIKKYETYKYRNAICIVVPWNFGGLELGMFFVRGERNNSVCAHEYGHGIQNLWWGPLFPFVVCIPSAYRYWMRNKKTQKEKYIFCSIVYLIVLSICIALFFIVALPAVKIIMALVAFYFTVLQFWMMVIEIPQYVKNVRYDDAWFEGEATRLGNLANEDTWSWL